MEERVTTPLVLIIVYVMSLLLVHTVSWTSMSVKIKLSVTQDCVKTNNTLGISATVLKDGQVTNNLRSIPQG
jgi:hypothetical protein